MLTLLETAQARVIVCESDIVAQCDGVLDLDLDESEIQQAPIGIEAQPQRFFPGRIVSVPNDSLGSNRARI